MTEDVIVRGKDKKEIREGDTVVLSFGEESIRGKMMYDKAFWAYAVRGDNNLRYLLRGNLTNCTMDEDGIFYYENIERIDLDE